MMVCMFRLVPMVIVFVAIPRVLEALGRLLAVGPCAWWG